ncbi:hypothetical protein GLOIN_2v1789942 [Rhizophagus irregularis DAOM 181602=DAOM 197198]|uniref:Uncharacterized protein n=1 Tax=Rhizophagus irregularis (strain DAOM 181602 / DAOM 197198 / MUCL 43194) TaxID=747089 RepID=A0A2P4P079_RHIID|nr:hypothetical protein GLOIN_2v1789942 [Rhizophagus irregularis DAOM 181602=DAOM 197198]POG58778.1 hypothetical protein GLOIN_2v1789942 [Rhizophagus irregularis DAOM 181602=DAOM 197198]|eukprot:XP_025165644.1 hypothetical protein GLOIN_2v1789942 [Rhizophagus irregularis DAOM 181602=DAOM 197198]
MTKPQTKVSWVWEYFVRKQSENGEIRAYFLKILPSIKGKEKEAVILNVENDDAEDDETPEEINVITNTREALNSLEKVIRYFKNPPDNIATNYTELKTFNTLRSKINGEFKMF